MSTGSALMDKFRARMQKAKISTDEEEFEVMYPTGFLALDYLNGTMIHVKSEKINTSYKSIGIVDGSSNMFIGRSGCGKSTLEFQIIGNIARQFSDALVYIDDIEGSLPMPRKEFLLGLSEDDIKNRVHFRNTGITTENVYQQIRAIHDIKIEDRKEFEYDTDLYDTYGKRIFKLVPTIYCIDSFAMLMPDDIVEKEELDNGMGASGMAKKNTQLIKKISQLLREANIILFTVNHINDDIQMGFLPKPAQISGLKQGERLPGGKAALYIANNLFRLDDKGTLKAAEGFGIDGNIVDLTLVKSRTNRNKRAIPLVFNKTEGNFDNILSMFQMIKAEGRIGGAGTHLYFDIAPDIKFSQKSFKEDLSSNPELQKAFAQVAKEVLEPLLSDTENKAAEVESFDLNNAVLSLA